MDWLSLLVAPLGVLFLAAVIWGLGGRIDARLEDEDHARRRYAEDDPLFRAGEVLLGDDGRAALIISEDGMQGVALRGFGDRIVTRPLAGALRAADLRETKDGRAILDLRLADPTCRKVIVDVTSRDAETRRRWLEAVSAFGPATLQARAA